MENKKNLQKLARAKFEALDLQDREMENAVQADIDKLSKDDRLAVARIFHMVAMEQYN